MKRLSSLLIFVTSIGSVSASINWSSTAGTALRDIDNTPLFAGGTTANPTGFFVQLIKDVDGDGPDPLNLANANGVGGDDVVVDVSFLGSFTASGGVVAGQLNAQSTGEPHEVNATYFMRFWNARTRAATISLGTGNESTPIPDFDSVTGINPVTGLLLRYGNSESFTATTPTTDPIRYSFSGPSTPLGVNAFTTNIPAVATVIPEPTTAGLLGIGMLGVISALRKRKQQA